MNRRNNTSGNPRSTRQRAPWRVAAPLLGLLALLGAPALGQNTEDVPVNVGVGVVRNNALVSGGGGVARQAQQAGQAQQAQQAQGFVSPFTASPAGAVGSLPLAPAQVNRPVTGFEGQLFANSPSVNISTFVPQLNVTRPVVARPSVATPDPVNEDAANLAGRQFGSQAPVFFAGSGDTGRVADSGTPPPPPPANVIQPQVIFLNEDLPATGQVDLFTTRVGAQVQVNEPAEDAPQDTAAAPPDTPKVDAPSPPAQQAEERPAVVQQPANAAALIAERRRRQRLQLQQLAVSLQEGALQNTAALLRNNAVEDVYDPSAFQPGLNAARQTAVQAAARRLGQLKREQEAEAGQLAVVAGVEDAMLLAAHRVQEELKKELEKEAEQTHEEARAELNDDDLEEGERRARRQRDAADRERRRRRRHPERERNARESTELQEDRDRLDEEGDGLEQEQDSLDDWQQDIEDRLDDAQEQERNARQGNPPPADPNCRSSACQQARQDQADLRQERVEADRYQTDLTMRQEAHDRTERNWNARNDDLQGRLDQGEGLTREEHRARLADNQAREARAEYEQWRNRVRELEARAEEGDLSRAEQRELTELRRNPVSGTEVERLEERAQQLQDDLRGRESLSALQDAQRNGTLTPDQRADLDWRTNRSSDLRDARESLSDEISTLDDEFDEWADRVEEETGRDPTDPNDFDDLPENVQQELQDFEQRRSNLNRQRYAVDDELEEIDEGWPTNGTFDDYSRQTYGDLTEYSNRLTGALDQIEEARNSIGRGGDRGPAATAGIESFDRARDAYDQTVEQAQQRADQVVQERQQAFEDLSDLDQEIRDRRLIQDLGRRGNLTRDERRTLDQARGRQDERYAERSIESLERELGRRSRQYQRAEQELDDLQRDINEAFDTLQNEQFFRQADAATNFARDYNAQYGDTVRADGSIDVGRVQQEVQALEHGLADVQARDAQIRHLQGARDGFRNEDATPNLTADQRQRGAAILDRRIAEANAAQEDTIRGLNERGFNIDREDDGRINVVTRNPLIANFEQAQNRARQTVAENPLLPAEQDRILVARAPARSTEDLRADMAQREADTQTLSAAYQRGGFEGYQRAREQIRQRDLTRLEAEDAPDPRDVNRAARLRVAQTRYEDQQAAEQTRRDRVGDLAIAAYGSDGFEDDRDRARRERRDAQFDASDENFSETEKRDTVLEFADERLNRLRARVQAGTLTDEDVQTFRDLRDQAEQAQTSIAATRNQIAQRPAGVGFDADTAARLEAQQEILDRQLPEIAEGLQAAIAAQQARDQRRLEEDAVRRFAAYGRVPERTSSLEGIGIDPPEEPAPVQPDEEGEIEDAPTADADREEDRAPEEAAAADRTDDAPEDAPEDEASLPERPAQLEADTSGQSEDPVEADEVEEEAASERVVVARAPRRDGHLAADAADVRAEVRRDQQQQTEDLVELSLEDGREHFLRWASQAVAGFVEPSEAGRQVLPRLLVSLADELGPEEAAQLTYRAIERFEDAHAPDAVRFVDALFDEAAAGAVARGDGQGQVVAQLARARFMDAVLQSGDVRAWGLSPVRVSELQVNLYNLVGELSESFGESARQARDTRGGSPVIELSALAAQLSLAELSASSAPDPRDVLRRIDEVFTRLERSEDFADPADAATAVRATTLVLEGRLAGLRQGASNADVQQALGRLVRGERLLRRALNGLLGEADGEDIDTIEQENIRSARREAGYQVAQGNFGEALQALYAQRDRPASIAGLVATLNDLEERFDTLDGRQLGTLYRIRDHRVHTVEDVRAERRRLLTEWSWRERDPARAAPVVLRLAAELAEEGNVAGAIETLEQGLERQPNNPIFLGERLRLQIAGEDAPSSATITESLNGLNEDLRAATVAVAANGLAARGNLAGLDALTDAVEDVPLGEDAGRRVGLQLDFAELAALRAQPPSDENDRRIAQALDAARRNLRSAEDLDPEVREGFEELLDRESDAFRQVIAWEAFLATNTPPPEGFLNLVRQAIAAGRLDVAQQGIYAHLSRLRTAAEEEGLDRPQFLGQIEETLSVLNLVRARLGDPALTEDQRALGEDFLTQSAREVESLLNGEILDVESAVPTRAVQLYDQRHLREDEEIAESQVESFERTIRNQLSYLRALSSLRLRVRLAAVPAEERDVFIIREYNQANTAVQEAETALLEGNDGLADLLEDGNIRRAFERDLGALNALRARRDGIEDFKLDRDPARAGFVGGSSRLLADRVVRNARFWRIQQVEIALNGFSTGRSLATNEENNRARTEGVRPRLRYLQSTDGPASVSPEDFENNYTRDVRFLENEEQYLQSRLFQLVYEDQSLTEEQQHALVDAHDRWYANILRQWGTYSPLTFPELTGMGAAERAEAQARLDFIDRNRLRRLEDRFNRAVEAEDAQAAFLAAVQLREAALAGEIDRYVQYVNFTWGRLGPVKAKRLILDSEDATESLIDATADAGLLQPALIRAAYRLPSELSESDRNFLTGRGFIVNGQYAIPEGFTLRPSAGTEDFSTESIVDEYVNAERAAELALTVAIPGGLSAKAATEVFGQLTLRYIARRALQEGGIRAVGSLAARKLAFEAALFTGLSRVAQVGLHPELLQNEDFWSISALGEEYLLNVAVLGGLKLTGGALGTGEGALARTLATPLERRPVELAFRAATGSAKLAGEAGVLTGLHGLLEGNAITQEDFIGNLLTVALLKGFHAGQPSQVGEFVARRRARRAQYEQFARRTALERQRVLLRDGEESTLREDTGVGSGGDASTRLDGIARLLNSDTSTLRDSEASTLRDRDSSTLTEDGLRPRDRSEDSTLRDRSEDATLRDRDGSPLSEDSSAARDREGSSSGPGGAAGAGGEGAALGMAGGVLLEGESSSRREDNAARNRESSSARQAGDAARQAERASLRDRRDANQEREDIPLTNDPALRANQAPVVAPATDTPRALRERLRGLAPGRVVVNQGTENEAELIIGDYRGDGRTTTAFTNGDPTRPNRVFRVLRRGFDEQDVRIDEYGQKRLSELEEGSNGLFRVTEDHGQWRVETVSDPRFADLQGAIITEVDSARGTASERVARQPDGVTRGQLHALDQTVRYLNRNGIIWTDNHFGNFDFEPVDLAGDIWRVVIFDTGGFYPAEGATELARYANARAVQEAFNLPSRQWLRQYQNARVLPQGPAREAVLEDLRRQRAAEAFSAADGRIDWVELFGRNEDWLLGSPLGTVGRPGYRSLASQDPAVADQLSLRHLGRRAPMDVPFDATAGFEGLRRPRTAQELDAIEDYLFRTGRSTPEDIFRVRETESQTLSAGP